MCLKFRFSQNSIYAARTLKISTFKRIVKSAMRRDPTDRDNALRLGLSRAWSWRKRKPFKTSIWYRTADQRSEARRNESGRKINLQLNRKQKLSLKLSLVYFQFFISRLSDIPSESNIYISPIYTHFHSAIGCEEKGKRASVIRWYI